MVREKSDRWAVWVWTGRRAERRTVTVGIMNDSYVEIVSGLTVGEEVLLTPEIGLTTSY